MVINYNHDKALFNTLMATRRGGTVSMLLGPQVKSRRYQRVKKKKRLTRHFKY